MSGWQRGEPTEPGVYIVRGEAHDVPGWMRAAWGSPYPVRLLGMVAVRVGPRGGQRAMRWVSPRGEKVGAWGETWEWNVTNE